MAGDLVVQVDGVDTGGQVSEAALRAALQRSDEFVRVSVGRRSMDAAPIDGSYVLATADENDRVVTLDEAAAALLAFATAARSDGAGPRPSPSPRTARQETKAARGAEDTPVFRSVGLPLIFIVAGLVAAIIGAQTEQSSGTGDPHFAALIAGTVCYFAWLASVLMFTMPVVRRRLEARLGVEIRSFDNHQNGWRVVDRGRYGAKLIVSGVLLLFVLSFFVVPLAIVIAAVALV